MEFNVTADSVPVLDQWGWDEYWKVPEWQRWHELMVHRYGARYANDKFLYWWEKQDSSANPYVWGKFDKNFVKYLDGYGIDISNAASNITLGADAIIKNTTKGVTFITKYLGWIIAAVILVIVIIVIIYLRSPADKKAVVAAHLLT